MVTKKTATKPRSSKRTASAAPKRAPRREPRRETKRTEAKPRKEKVKKEMPEYQRFIYGLSVLAVAAYLALSVFFYYVHWFEDQNIIESSTLFDAISGAMNGNKLANPCGPTGAMIGYYMVSIFFGAGALAVPIALTMWSLRILGVQWNMLKKTARLVTATLLMMILLSVSLGFAFETEWDMFGTGLGGEWGIYASQFLSSVVGEAGAIIILVLAWLIAIVYSNVNIVSAVGSAISRSFNFIFGIKPKPRRRPMPVRGNEYEPYPFLDDDEVIPIPDFVEATPEQLEPLEAEADKVAQEPEPEAVPMGVEADITLETPIKEEPVYQGLDIVGLDEINAQSEQAAPQTEVQVAGQTAEIAVGQAVSETTAQPAEIATGQPARESVAQPTAVAQGANAPLDKGLTINSTIREAVVADSDIDNTLYDPTRELSNYQRPPIELLEDHRNNVTVTKEEIVANTERIKQTLENFGIKIDHTSATVGPTVTLYEIVPSAGVRISKIKNLEDDIALSLSALGIRIIAPIPGKGTIGIEVPNKDKQIVSMYSVVKSVKFQQSKHDIPIVLGKTVQNETFVVDLAKMPHLLVAGATGQGKSVGLNAIITSILYKKHPAELKFVLVDPKKVELTPYAKLEKHFMAKMADENDVIITDNQRVIQTLNSLCKEMDNRYNLLNAAEVRNLKDYNNKFIHRRLNPNNGHKFLPYIVVIIDEFADLIMTAGREIEMPIARLAQLGRAAGMHIIIATQRPTTNIITGMIKANFPARVAFRVTSMIDSRTILDQPGANQLIGRGDMLVSTGSEVTRVQCAFADTPEVELITEFISNQRGYSESYELPEIESEAADASGSAKSNEPPTDPMFKNIAYFVVQNNAGSTSAIQRRFSIGYNRAGRITDQLESAGIVGRAEGSKPREVLINDVVSLEAILNGLGIK